MTYTYIVMAILTFIYHNPRLLAYSTYGYIFLLWIGMTFVGIEQKYKSAKRNLYATQSKLDICQEQLQTTKQKLEQSPLKHQLEQMTLDSKDNLATIQSLTAANESLDKQLKKAFESHNRTKCKLEEAIKTIADISSAAILIPEEQRKYYRHYKGGVYRQIGIAINTDSINNTSSIIVYQSLIDNKMYTRTNSKFFANIPQRAAKEMGIKFKVGDTLPPRFAEITQAEAEEIAANWKHEQKSDTSADNEKE